MKTVIKKKWDDRHRVGDGGVAIELHLYRYIFTYSMISSCSSQMLPRSIFDSPLILHDPVFTGSKFHSSSLQRLCFKQELAGNTIALKRCDLLWGKLRLIMMKCRGFFVSWGQTLLFSKW